MTQPLLQRADVANVSVVPPSAVTIQLRLFELTAPEPEITTGLLKLLLGSSRVTSVSDLGGWR